MYDKISPKIELFCIVFGNPVTYVFSCRYFVYRKAIAWKAIRADGFWQVANRKSSFRFPQQELSVPRVHLYAVESAFTSIS